MKRKLIEDSPRNQLCLFRDHIETTKMIFKKHNTDYILKLICSMMINDEKNYAEKVNEIMLTNYKNYDGAPFREKDNEWSLKKYERLLTKLKSYDQPTQLLDICRQCISVNSDQLKTLQFVGIILDVIRIKKEFGARKFRINRIKIQEFDGKVAFTLSIADVLTSCSSEIMIKTSLNQVKDHLKYELIRLPRANTEGISLTMDVFSDVVAIFNNETNQPQEDSFMVMRRILETNIDEFYNEIMNQNVLDISHLYRIFPAPFVKIEHVIIPESRKK